MFFGTVVALRVNQMPIHVWDENSKLKKQKRRIKMKKSLKTLFATVVTLFVLSSVSAHAQMYTFEKYLPKLTKKQLLPPSDMPDFRIGIATVGWRHAPGFYNKEWSFSVAVKNFGGNEGISEGQQIPVYVDLSYYYKYNEWNYQTQRYDLKIELKSKTEVFWINVPMAGEHTIKTFSYYLRDYQGTGTLYCQQIPHNVFFYADTVDGRPGGVEESNENNNGHGVTVSYRSGNNIIYLPYSFYYGRWGYVDDNFYD